MRMRMSVLTLAIVALAGGVTLSSPSRVGADDDVIYQYNPCNPKIQKCK